MDRLKVMGQNKIIHISGIQKKGVSILASDKINFESKIVKRTNEVTM